MSALVCSKLGCGNEPAPNQRYCKPCRREAQREHYLRKRDELQAYRALRPALIQAKDLLDRAAQGTVHA